MPSVQSSIPVVQAPPIVGSLLPMLRDPVRLFVDAYRSCGEVFRLDVLNRRFVVIAGVEANRFMIRHEREFLKVGPIFGGFGHELGGELFLAAADGETHERLRRIQTPSYSDNHLKTRTTEVVAGLQQRLGALRVGQRLDVQRVFQLLLAEQVGLLLHNHAELASILDDLIRVFRVALSVKVMRQWPPALLHWPAYRHSKARILEHAAKVAAEHRASPSKDRSDLVDDILTAVDRKDTIAEENIRLLTLGPLFGGIDTASNTCALTLYNILARPDVKARVMREVRDVFAENPTPNWDGFKEMPALRGTIMETLRMYPVVYLASRYVAKSFEFAGQTIAAGENLFVATVVPHYLPELYPDPQRFDIDRFGPDRREHAKPGAFAPFGTGVHSCLGARFAQAQMQVTLATMLHQLDLSIDPPDYQLRVKSNPVTMPDGFVVRVQSVRETNARPAAPWPGFSVEPRRGLLGRFMR